MYLSALPMVALFLSLAHATALQSRSNTGKATFYGGNLHGGSCMFSTYTLPSGIFGTALSDFNWDTAANCGACAEVTMQGGSTIMAMIVDRCPGCDLNQLDLFPDAFSTLANPNRGVIPISWSIVDCGITSPLEVHNKGGVSQWWFSMQVVNSNRPVSSLEVSTDGGATWGSTTRTSYNFFEHSSGFGPTVVVDVKVTSVDGEVIIVKNVQIAGEASTTGPTNFGHGSMPPQSSPVPAATSTSSTTVPSLPQGTTSVPGVVAPISTSRTSSTSTTCTSIPPAGMASSAIQSQPSAQPATPNPAQTSVAAVSTSTVTVYSYAACTKR